MSPTKLPPFQFTLPRIWEGFKSLPEHFYELAEEDAAEAGLAAGCAAVFFGLLSVVVFLLWMISPLLLLIPLMVILAYDGLRYVGRCQKELREGFLE